MDQRHLLVAQMLKNQFCSGLLDLKNVFDSFVHAGRSLRRQRAIFPKPADVAYRDLSKQDEFLVKSVFNGDGSYLAS